MKQNNMLAMILAGGRGSRLHELTNKVAKPAVSYGGKYRIVDFPLSNCANSGVDIVGVLTQYESVLLNSYVAAGGRWGLDARESGVVCNKCEHGKVKVSPATLYTLQYILYSSIERLYTFKVSADVLWELKKIIREYMRYHVNHEFKSLSFL